MSKRWMPPLAAVTALLVGLVFVVGGVRAAAQAPSGLERLLTAELDRMPARAGIWVKHLGTGETAGVRATDTFNSASVIKLPVLALAFQMAERGELSLDERVTIRREDIRGGSGIYRYHDPGLQPTFRDVLLQMVITSDNTATDLAIAKVGGVAPVNAWIAAHGYAPGMKLTQTTGALFEKYRALDPSQTNEKTNHDRAYWLGELTPESTGRLLEAIYRASEGAPSAIVNKTNGADMMRMLRAQQAGARRLPHYLDVPVAHKTGDFPPVLANDVGVILSDSGPIVVAFFLNEIAEPYGEAEDRMGAVARLIVDYFDGTGRRH
ncbi:MAG: serine hydrolase [Vicinamibacterales bacterium]